MVTCLMPQEGKSDFYRPKKDLPTPGMPVYENRSGSPFTKLGAKIAFEAPTTQPNKFVVVSKDAGRTVEDQIVGKKAVWGGELPGDIYGDRDQKGGRQDRILRLQIDPYHGFRVEGMNVYDPKYLEKVNKVSEFLRQNGLPTEKLTTVYELKNKLMAPNGHLYEIDRLKVRAITVFRDQLTKMGESDVGKTINSAWQWLKDVKFSIEERDLKVAERLRGARYAVSSEDFKRMVSPVFQWLKVATDTRGQGLITGTEKPGRLSLDGEDLQIYFGRWLPDQMATYLSRMHTLRAVHGNATAQNWSLVGTLYDLDTVKVQALGDQLPKGGIEDDVNCTLGALEELLAPHEGNYIANSFGKQLLLQAQAVFLKRYLEERFHNLKLFKKKNFKVKYWDNNAWRTRPFGDEEWSLIEKLVSGRDKLTGEIIK